MHEYRGSPQGAFPEIVSSPWTGEARQRALEQAVEEHYINYFGRAMQCRTWSPWHQFSPDELRQWGQRLSVETVDLIEGFFGVEEYVGDYVQEGLEMFRHDRIRRNLQLQGGQKRPSTGSHGNSC